MNNTVSNRTKYIGSIPFPYPPLTCSSYFALSLIIKAAASPFNGSDGFGYSKSCGRNTSKTFTRSANRNNAKPSIKPKISITICYRLYKRYFKDIHNICK